MVIRRLTAARQFLILADEITPLLADWIRREGWANDPSGLFDAMVSAANDATTNAVWLGLTDAGLVGGIAMGTLQGLTVRIELLEMARDLSDRRRGEDELLSAIEAWAKEQGSKRLIYRTNRVRNGDGGPVPERHIRRRLYPHGFKPVAIDLEKRLENRQDGEDGAVAG